MQANDTRILRELGQRIAEAAEEDAGRDVVGLWKRLNGLKPARPMVMIDQLPWNELNESGELTLHCSDPFLRSLECDLRQRLYQYRHFRADLPMHREVVIQKSVGIDYGIGVREATLAGDPTSGVVSHHYEDQIPDEAALARIPMPTVTVDEALDRQRIERAGNIFDGILPLKVMGQSWRYGTYGGAWDRITSLRGADPLIYDLADRPEFSMKVIARFAAMWNHLVDRFEALGLLDADPRLVHCTGAYTDELPSPGYAGGKPRAKDTWIFGLAQIFSTVSPAMHEEFEIEPMRPVLERFGLVYYGCCDPLDRKIEIVRKIRNVRKISVSPWADAERSAADMAGDFVLSAKPNPSHLAMATFDAQLVRRELQHIVDVSRKHNTPCELILKDVSTVRYEPQRLTAWERIAREVVGAS